MSSMNKARLDLYTNNNKHKTKSKSSKSILGSTSINVTNQCNDSLLSSVEQITGIASKPNMKASCSGTKICNPIHYASSLTNTFCSSYRPHLSNNSSSTYNKPSRSVRYSGPARSIRAQSLLSTTKVSKHLLGPSTKSTIIGKTSKTTKCHDSTDDSEHYHVEMISRSTSPMRPTSSRIIDTDAKNNGDSNNIKNGNSNHKNGRGSDHDDERKY
ncbi:hypothetical protein BLA29_007453 [Euroglyphus maynei]|uniref:Uncharacterized protein n=1 Tax=Euroglyphus maynei TaxID=6958 RepID=A0A1Y3B8K6_EURMA|nr:hypothetical protein BLA29_007453 [Euroglyphus maynei]